MLSEFVKSKVNEIDLPSISGARSFVNWLKFIHGIMLSSSPLLDFAASKSSGALREYYRNHANEERDHAAWMEADLAVLGEKPQPMDHAIAATAGAQYYYIQHIAPEALLGYCAAMEFRPMPLEHVDALAKVFGADALRTVRYHAKNDIDHGRDLTDMIDRHEDFATPIAYNAYVTRKMLAFFLNERMHHA